jgi:peptidoglycan/LPS O-acetylase OafA/YrhL
LLTWLGVVSYGVYLWHAPLIFWLADPNGIKWSATTPISHFAPAVVFEQHPALACLLLGSLGLSLTLVAASISYYFVELPFLRWKEVTFHSLWRRFRPAVAKA